MTGESFAVDCRFRQTECHTCGKKGHTARVFRSGKGASKPPKQARRDKPGRQHQSHMLASEEDPAEDCMYILFNLTSDPCKPLSTTLTVNCVELPMQIDIGASVSVISEETFHLLWPATAALEVQRTGIKLRTYSGGELEVKGAIMVDVSYKGQESHLRLVVLSGNGPSPLGRLVGQDLMDHSWARCSW